MRSFVYPAKLIPEPDGGFSAAFPDVPEAFGCGDDRQEALATARDALADALLTYIELGRDIPAPAARGRGLVPVALPAQVAAKLAVWQAWRAAGISKSELARRLGVGETEARRILDPDHATNLERLEAALTALGQRLVIGVDRAA
jgi:antitoxin HicB